jgi:hypothetical protein
MTLNQSSSVAGTVPTTKLFQRLAAILCVLFGIALIANTQPAGDGVWFWYATFFRNGNRLYSGMHLAMQPLFVLETSWFMTLLGKGWLVSKVPAVLHLIAYCFGLLLLANASTLSDKKKAFFLVSTFFISIAFEAYRFDDYHVLADCFEVYSLVLLLKLPSGTAASRSRSLYMAAGLGVLSGLALMTRLNDGAALFVGVAISILCLASARKLISVLLFALVAALTVILIVKLTGDSFHDYSMYSIFKAAAIKGGAGNVLIYPLRLPFNTLRWLAHQWHTKASLYPILAALSWAFLVKSSRSWKERREIWKPILGLGLILLPLPFIYHLFFDNGIINSLTGIGTVAAYAIGIVVVLRFCLSIIRPQRNTWNPREILLIIPLGQLASSSMSSGGLHVGLSGPLAIMLILLPIVWPTENKSRHLYGVLSALLIILLGNCVLYKISIPFSWHSYRAKPLFVDRQWYRHPDYGPMIIATQQLALIKDVCNSIASDPAPHDLLSLPFSYANYFCAIPPWHNYVQTFFDTSTRETILGLTGELQSSPPHWILYQRQLDSMALHERIFNQGNPLPHRYLDQVIEQKLADGEWQTVLTSKYGDRPNWSNEWIMINTQPAPPQTTGRKLGK